MVKSKVFFENPYEYKWMINKKNLTKDIDDISWFFKFLDKNGVLEEFFFEYYKRQKGVMRFIPLYKPVPIKDFLEQQSPLFYITRGIPWSTSNRGLQYWRNLHYVWEKHISKHHEE